MAALSADALALLRQVQQILTPPKFAPGALEMFFVVNCINDKEELAAMLDEPALMECGIARAPSRVAISRITAEILETSGESTQATDEETCCVDAQQAADQAAEFVRLAEAEARSQPRASAAMSDIETMLATRGTAAGSDAIHARHESHQSSEPEVTVTRTAPEPEVVVEVVESHMDYSIRGHPQQVSIHTTRTAAPVTPRAEDDMPIADKGSPDSLFLSRLARSEAGSRGASGSPMTMTMSPLTTQAVPAETVDKLESEPASHAVEPCNGTASSEGEKEDFSALKAQMAEEARLIEAEEEELAAMSPEDRATQGVQEEDLGQFSWTKDKMSAYNSYFERKKEAAHTSQHPAPTEFLPLIARFPHHQGHHAAFYQPGNPHAFQPHGPHSTIPRSEWGWM